MKIKKKYAPYISAILMSLGMATVMSFAMAFRNVGMGPMLLSAFTRSWPIAICVAIPTGLVLRPQIQKVVSYITA